MDRQQGRGGNKRAPKPHDDEAGETQRRRRWLTVAEQDAVRTCASPHEDRAHITTHVMWVDSKYYSVRTLQTRTVKRGAPRE